MENGDTVLPPRTPGWAVYIGAPTGLPLDPRLDEDRFLNPWANEELCSGSLIAHSWVLTAAHCVAREAAAEAPTYVRDSRAVNINYTTLSPDKLNAVIGRGNLEDSAQGFERRIASIHLHPQFRFVGELMGEDFPCRTYKDATCRRLVYKHARYDIALLRLERPVPADVQTVQLSGTSPEPGSKSEFFGYGYVDSKRRATRELRKTRIGSFSTAADCPGKQREQFCNQPTAGSRVHRGDSGGPWLREGTATQIGVHNGDSLDNALELAFSVSEALEWIRSVADLPAANTPDENSIAMALVIDSSGSMATNDPRRRRIDAGHAYLAAAGSTDAVAVVDFDGRARVASEARNPRSESSQLLAALKTIDSTGDTNIGVAVRSACDVLSRSGNQPGKAAILLTDGAGNYGGENGCFVRNKWRLYTFGLGSAVNTDLLTKIAEETGGRYKNLASVEDFYCEFQQVRAAVVGVSGQVCDPPELIRLKETLIKQLNIPPRQLQTVFTVSWPGSDIDMTAVSPSGRRITVNTEEFDVTAATSPVFEIITVFRPEPGQWKIELFGTDVAPTGTPVSFATTHVPLVNKLPIAAIGEPVVVDRRTGTFRFEATGSHDPDGPLVDYLWDFGDGLAGAGESVTHRFPAPGTFQVRLTVVDESLETATTEIAVVVSTGPTNRVQTWFIVPLLGLVILGIAIVVARLRRPRHVNSRQ